MEIFNTSIEDLADTFLHPGYTSAYVEVTAPADMTAAIVPLDKEPVLALDMKAALTLNEPLRDAVGTGTISKSPSSGYALGIIVTAVIAVAMAERLSRTSVPRKRAAYLATTVALAVLAACAKEEPIIVPEAVAEPAPPTKEPGAPTDVPYARPRDATIAILHGIVADAVACSHADPLDELSDAEDQVGLPVSNPTAGMRWAVANYVDDGWGRPFRFEPVGDRRYRVSSSGEDGQFGGADDITIEVGKADAFAWPKQLHSFFLRKERKDTGVSYHRCGPKGRARRELQPMTSRGLSSHATHGVLQSWELPASKREAVIKRLSAEGDQLLMVMYRPQDMGHPVLRKVSVYRW